jgi:hypothetical protein
MTSKPWFKDISQFNKKEDYLPIFSGVLFVETITIYLALLGVLKSRSLETWYTKYRLAAVLADIIIVSIIIIVTRYLYPFFFSTFFIVYFVCLAIVVQIIHDVLFYLVIRMVPKGRNAMIDTFKGYAKEVGIYAILGDSIVITSACLMTSFMANYTINYNIISLVATIYFIPYILYTK